MPKKVDKSHIVVNKSDKDFPVLGLKVTSTIYLDKIATISKNLIIGEIGQITKRIKRKFNRQISKVYRI